ncbi:MAG: hypothetical protein E7605_09150 [Ruminococcaceae bacterium]|nr:hypothetical protein [Oscillospiraceae bacterium]
MTDLILKCVLLLTLTLHFVRVRCTGMDVTSLSFNKEVTKKVNQDVPSWNSLDVAALQSETGERHFIFYASLDGKPLRAAGGENRFCFIFSAAGCVVKSKSFG